MANTKNVSIVDEKDREHDPYTPTDKERDVVESVFHKFRDAADSRNRSFSYLDDRSITTYIDDCVERTITNVDSRDGIEDWQARVHDPFTRNKVLAVLSKVVQVLPIAELRHRGDEDMRRAQILTNLYDYSEDADDYSDFSINFLYEAVVKGTAVGYEGHLEKVRKVRDIKKVKGDDDQQEELEVEETEIRENNLFAQVVKLEDFYPSSVGQQKVKDMPYCFWRNVMNYQQFLQDFANFKKADDVQPRQTHHEEEDQQFYEDYISDSVDDGKVEVIRYYNQDTDEFIIIANGIWLNPVKIDDETEVTSPLPFNHKTLPFFELRMELLGTDFFYGKSLPDKLKSMQDVLNALTNMVLDQSFLTIFPPLLTNGMDSIEDDYLKPGRRTPVDTQGLSIDKSFQTLDLGTPQNWHKFILEYTRDIMEEASVGQVQQGVAGVGDRTTAQEIRVAAQGVAAMLGLFGRFVNSAIKRKAKLRAQNIMQFWTDENSPMIEKVLGQGGTEKANKAFNTFEVDNTVMTSGDRGRKIIELYKNQEDMPTRKQVKTRAALSEAETNEKIEIVAVPAEYIRDVEFDVVLVPNPKSEVTKESEKALELEKTRVYMSFFPDLVDKKELFANLAEVYDDDPVKIMKQQSQEQQMSPQQAQESPEAAAPESMDPQGNVGDNIRRGAQSGEQSANALQQLQTEMTG